MSAILSPAEVMRAHPCFDEQAHARVGRVHLPVASRCNIRCAFCEHKVCANLTMQHPGWAQRLLSVEEAVARVRELKQRWPGASFVVGVAGPGEPLANDATFAALAAIRDEFGIMTCVSTNGLLLEEKLPQLLEARVMALTVTVNASRSGVGQHIYLWARYEGRLYRGIEAAELLIAHQMRGIRAALSAGLSVKVNTVFIPDVNNQDVVPLAHKLRELGVHLMNLMPLIPDGRMRSLRAPTCDELRRARAACERVIPQFRLCEHCSADIVYLPNIPMMQ